MHYEINVRKAGKHLFATAERSLRSLDETRALYTLLAAKFPPAEGYEVEAYQISKVGTQVDEGDLATPADSPALRRAKR